MKIISLLNEFTKDFNEIFCKNLSPLNLESKIRETGDAFTLHFYTSFLNYLDERFKNSKERKANYSVKETVKRGLITSVGYITVNSTIYYHKETKERYVPLRDILDIKPYQRLTNEAEYQLIRYTMHDSMAKAGMYALRNVVVSRSTVSKKLATLDGRIEENIVRVFEQPEVLYIEMDEIHANLQHGGNKICPAAIVHEGYVESFAKRKVLKNIKHFSHTETYEELWEVIFDYVDKKYDISKFKVIFISGDGAPGIKNFKRCFPNAIFVLDPFHYFRKHLTPIFKNNKKLMSIADNYIRNDKIDDFKTLVNIQIEKYPDQEKEMIKHMNFILNNIDGIKNQNHGDYKVHCSMEGHISQAFARYITSSPFGFSERGLKNKLKLLVYLANKVDLTMEDYYHLKFGTDNYKEINNEINKLLNIKYDRKLLSNHSADYSIDVPVPLFDTPEMNNKLSEMIAPRGIKFI